LESAGLHLLRFTNVEVLTETQAVVEAIWLAVKAYEPLHE
jgi:very-short-patch-repair endonuclease